MHSCCVDISVSAQNARLALYANDYYAPRAVEGFIFTTKASLFVLCGWQVYLEAISHGRLGLDAMAAH